MTNDFDVAVIGAGAAGLMAAIFAARSGARTIALEGANRVGAKILISGGGRCNVTHDVVRATGFNGNRNAIAKVLRTFDVPQTIAFFEELGVRLRREETGKLFPVTDRARTVVDALLRAAAEARATVATGHRVTGVAWAGDRFSVATVQGEIRARRVVLATGGRSVPKTGSDGFGYQIARAFGHSVTETFPALVPLVLPEGQWAPALSGTSVEAELEVRSGGGRVLHRERGSMLFTHFGISGPVVLDISRHWIAAQRSGGADGLFANLLPGETLESLDAALVAEGRRNPRATPSSVLRGRLPERVVEALCAEGGVDAGKALSQLSRASRRRLVRSVVGLPLPVVRDRGFDYAEVTAGGVPLSEVELATMESRKREGLFLCGEILDVDGKIGGYNFQWAWASGRLAGLSAA